MSLRLEGLGRSIDLLTSVEWSGVAMRRLVESQTTNFVDTAGRIDIRGKDFAMKPEAVQNLGLALHELATNAVKYGALSGPNGKILIEWEETASEDGVPQIRLRWIETGGPPTRAPKRAGFGTTIIERHTVAAFSGKVELNYAQTGLRWELVAPRSALMLEQRNT
jgi:two-component sensor histidine kinase